MSSPDTITAEKFFVESAPSWDQEEGVGSVVCSMEYNTVITASYNNAEQRTSRASLPSHLQTWQCLLKGVGIFSAAKARNYRSMNKTLVVPLWGKGFEPTSWVSANQIDTGRDLSLRPEWRAGQYVYMVAPDGTGAFRLITSISGGGNNLVNFTGTDFDYPEETATTFPAGSVIYPCFMGVRAEGNQQALKEVRLDEVVEYWSIKEL